MLKADLLRVRQGADGTFHPAYANVKNRALLARAEELIGLFEQCAGRIRGDLEELATVFAKGAGDRKLNAALTELLFDCCTFQAASKVPAETIRGELFRLGAQHFPLGLTGTGPSREDALAQAAAALGIPAQNVEAWMFSDLKEKQVLERFVPPEPKALLERYNVALAQGLLLHAQALEVTLSGTEPVRLRQLFRFLKFFRLLSTVSYADDSVTIRVDGPLSVIEHTKAYGLRLANFLPALLLLDEFSATAHLSWKRRRRQFHISHKDGLVSHYRDVGAWVPEEMQHFEQRLRTLVPASVRISEPTVLVPLAGREVYVPDLALRRGTKEALLEIVWPWKKLRFARYYELFARFAPPNAFLALPAKLVSQEFLRHSHDHRIITFRATPPADRILQAILAWMAGGTLL